MPRMSKKRRLEWSFFLRQVKVGNTTCDRITYNDLCRGCTHSCKQSFRAVIILLSLIHIYLIYACYGVKNGEWKSAAGGFKDFTSADIGSYWNNVNTELEAIPINESELP